MKGETVKKPFERPTLSRVLRLTRKELRETLRDRRTVITLVLMPLLVYPLLSISFNKSLLLTSGQATKPSLVIGVDSEEDFDILKSLLLEGGRFLETKKKFLRVDENGLQREATDGTSPIEIEGEQVDMNWFGGTSLENHVADLDVHVGVRVRSARPETQEGAKEGLSKTPPFQCELIYREDSVSSKRAMRFVEERLRAVNQATLQMHLVRLGRLPELRAEVAFKPISSGTGAPFSLATLVPLVLILMTITGAVYPAIDLTAGERERGTLETLIAAPISRITLLVAKYAAVLTVAVLTAMVNLVAMTVTLLTSALGTQLFPGGLSPVLMAEIFGLMILFAAFFSAIVLALTSFARSFKEAQAYLIPVMLLAISPGLLSLMPGLELSGMLALAPLVNIVLLSRDILEGTVNPAMAAVAILSTGVYAAAAITIASRIFGNDALLYASRGSWSDLFQRPTSRNPAATPTGTLACLATLFPCFFLLANLAQHAGSTSTQLLFNSLVTIAVFGGWPLMFAFAQRVSLLSGFQIRRAPPLAFVGAVVLGLALWPFAFEIYLFGEWAGLATLDKNQFAVAEQLLTTFRKLSPALLLLSLAVVPAVMEEFFFRGYLFNGLRSRFPGPLIIVITALLFGVFHVLSPSALMPERFLPSTLLGLLLGWVCYRTGSVLPGMLLHAGHNGFLLLMVQHQDKLEARGWDLKNSMHIPLGWLLSLGAVAVAAAAVIVFATRRVGKSKGEGVRIEN